MNTNRKLTAAESGYWPKWFGKLFFSLISVKVWGLVAGMGVSTWLLMVHLSHPPVIVGGTIIEYGINGAQWVTFNTTIWALIFGMKEIFRISEQHDFSEQVNIKENLDNKVRIAGMISGRRRVEEFEIVGKEPDLDLAD